MNENKEEINLNSYYSGSGKRKYKKRKRSNRFIKWWKNLKNWKKITLCVTAGILAVLILFGSIAAIYINVILDKLGSDDDFSKLNSSDLGIENVIDENIFNIALFGVDSRKKGDFTGLSDSIMILSVNKVDNTVKLVSIMRDSLVPIEYKGKTSYNKINSVYKTGGPALAVKTLNSLYGLDISAYATVNFFGMADIIDAVGGIEIEVTQDEIDAGVYGINGLINEIYGILGIYSHPYYILKPGTHKVNGVQAVAYSRIRKAENAYGSNNDFGRTERQRIVMKKIMEKALSMDVTTYPSLIKKLTPYVKTSLSNSQMLSLAAQLAKKPTLIQTRVPHDEYIINADYRGTGASTVYYNYKYAGKIIRAFLYEDILPEDYIASNGVDRTGWYNSGSSSSSEDNSSSNNSSYNNSSDIDDESSQMSSGDQNSSGSSSTPSNEEPDDDTSENDSSGPQGSGGEENPDEDNSDSNEESDTQTTTP